MLILIFVSVLLSILINLWPLKLFRVGLSQLQAFFINSKELLMGKLGFIGIVEKN